MNPSLRKAIKLAPSLSLALTVWSASPIALAANALAKAEFLGISSVRTTGSAMFELGTHSLFEASGIFSGGTEDPANDGMTFDSTVSLFGEGTATNSGAAGATSLVDSSGNNDAHAFTFFDGEILLSGTGSIEIDLSYKLTVDAFGNLPSAFALAQIEAHTTFTNPILATLELSGLDVTGIGASDTLMGILTLVLAIDTGDIPEPIVDSLFIHTRADALSAPVPVPAAVWLLGSALVGIGGLRRRLA